MSTKEVFMYTNLSEYKVKEIIAHFKRTGTIDVPKCDIPH